MADWDPEVPPRSFSPFPIKGDLMIEKVLREMGVVDVHKSDPRMPVPVLPGKKAWIVMLLRGEITYEFFAESKSLSWV